MQTILPKKEMTLNEITQKNTLEEIGQLLREKREEQDYTLEQVAEITKITASTLHNIESGNLDDLPGFVFVKGFIRNYANLLKINSDAMIKELNAAYEASNEDACPDIEIEDKNLKSENNA